MVRASSTAAEEGRRSDVSVTADSDAVRVMRADVGRAPVLLSRRIDTSDT